MNTWSVHHSIEPFPVDKTASNLVNAVKQTKVRISF